MRILIVVEHFPCISETFVLNQVTGLLDQGHDVEVYPIGRPVAPVVHPDHFKYQLETRTWKGANNPPNRMKRILGVVKQLPRCLTRSPLATFQAFNVFKYKKEAANLYLFYTILPFMEKRGKYDLVHCHFGDKGVLARKWCQMGLISDRLSVVFHAHEMAGLSDEVGRRLYSDLFKSNALILPISEHWRKLLIRWGANPDRTIVHHMGVDCNKIRFAPKKADLNSPFHILSVCRLTEMKGIEYAIRAFAEVRKRCSGIRYTIVGDGPLRASLESLVESLKIQDVVAFAGPQSQDRVQAFLGDANLFLAPSVTDSNGCTEGIPVALMEAMAAGVPVVATRHAGNPELITDGISGMLVEERNTMQLAQAIEKLITNPELCKVLAQNAREKVENDFSVQKLNCRLEGLFKSYIGPCA